MTTKNANKIMSFCIFGKMSYENTSLYCDLQCPNVIL
jgi:hypothetical protein